MRYIRFCINEGGILIQVMLIYINQTGVYKCKFLNYSCPVIGYLQLFDLHMAKPNGRSGMFALQAYVATRLQLGERRAEPRWNF